MNKTAVCVDLDGSLIYTDSLLESFIAALKQQPWILFLCIFWCLFKSRAYCKQQLAKRVNIEHLSLPQNRALIHWLQQQKQLGHACFLVTAADQRIADSIQLTTPLFDDAFGSDGTANLKGKHKRDFLDQRFGKGQYIYVGNSPSDLAIFKHAKSAVVISHKKRFIQKAKRISKVGQVFSGAQNNL
jgi:phosphoserine phosphatase